MNVSLAAGGRAAVRCCSRKQYIISPTTFIRCISRYDSPINGPLSTLPAPLDIPPPRRPEQSVFSYYFQLGKGYLVFYKNGLKNAAWVNPRLVRPVMTKWRESKGYAGIRQNTWLTRSDLQLLKRHQHDIRRIPLFALLFTVCGEFTPLVVAAFSNIVPITCRIPTQVAHDRRKRDERQTASFENYLPSSSINRSVERLEQMTFREKVHCSTMVGRHSNLWPSRILPLPFEWLLTRRLQRYEIYLETDDMLIAKGGGVMLLSPAELEIACMDRGIKVIDKPEAQLRSDLQRWLSDRKKGITMWERWLALPRP